jgi:RNA-directed DNA polymerase
VDRRIGGACAKAGLVYTRFVDDVAISGPFNLEKGGFAKLVEKILADDGFSVNRSKHVFGKLNENLSITSLRTVRGHLDVRTEYLDELVRQIDDAVSLARDEEFNGPYYTAGQILGRVRFVCWVNPGRKRELIRRFRTVNWRAVNAFARKRGYEATRKTLSQMPKRDKRA